MITTEQIYEMMEQGNLGYACVFKPEDHGKHTDFLFPMTPKNIANFIGQNAFTADKIVMTDFCDQLICESIYGGQHFPQYRNEDCVMEVKVCTETRLILPSEERSLSLQSPQMQQNFGT